MNIYQKDINRLAVQYAELSVEFGYNTTFRSFRKRIRQIIKLKGVDYPVMGD